MSIQLENGKLPRRIDTIERRRNKRRYKSANTKPWSELTERESHLLRLLCRGWSLKQACRELEISQGTGSEYVLRIKTRTGAHNHVQLGMWAARNGFV